MKLRVVKRVNPSRTPRARRLLNLARSPPQISPFLDSSLRVNNVPRVTDRPRCTSYVRTSPYQRLPSPSSHRKVKSFMIHTGPHWVVLISISVSISQPNTSLHCQTTSITPCACSLLSFRRYSFRLPTEGRPGRVDLSGWLDTELVYPPTPGYQSEC